MKRNFTKKELTKLIQSPNKDAVLHHVVFCPECNPAYTAISTHTIKQRMLAFMEDNNIDKRTHFFTWAKGNLRK